MANEFLNITKGPGTESDSFAKENAFVQRTNYLITIGIDNYKANQAFKSLNGSCEKDCAEVTRVLTKTYGFTVFKALKNEEASLENIKACLNQFLNDAEKNNPAANLIVYYSGHGVLYKPNTKVELAGWVPQDCENAGNHNQLFILNTDMFGALGTYQHLNVQHFAMVSDACFSAGAANFTQLFTASPEGEKGLSVEDERSCWALCSSRSNEVSLISALGDNSDFTKAMIEVLEANQDKELLLGEVASGIEKIFLQRGPTQKPYCKRLDVLENNTGQFVLRANEEIINTTKKQKLLPDKLKSLDYKNQREKLADLKNGKTHFFTIISAPVDAGLKFLNQKVVCSSSYFPGKGHPYFPVNVLYSSSTNDELVIEIFNLALKKNFTSLDSLKNHVQTLLAVKPLSIEFKFQTKEWLLASKKNLLSNTAKFVQSIHAGNDELMPLFIFIIDPDATDYSAFDDDVFFKNASKLIMPNVDSIDEDILVNWYDSVSNEEFDQLFKKVIVTDIASSLTGSKQLPGEVIRKICIASGCRDLAIQLLDD